MLEIKLTVDARILPQGVKELIAMDLEQRFGATVRVVSVREIPMEQMKISDTRP